MHICVIVNGITFTVLYWKREELRAIGHLYVFTTLPEVRITMNRIIVSMIVDSGLLNCYKYKYKYHRRYINNARDIFNYRTRYNKYRARYINTAGDI